MLPAHERLDAVDLARGALDLRLEREAQLVALDREREVADDPNQAPRPILLTEPIDRARLVARERVGACARRAPAKLRGIAAVLGVARDARGRGERDRRAVDADAGA